MAYDPTNIFARILRGELPCKRVFEDEHVLAFEDIRPLAPVHILVIPKGSYISMADFTASASDAEVLAFTRAIGRIARERGLDEPGYRVLANHGADANQEIPHLHVHIFGGRPLGRMLSRSVESGGGSPSR
jgi:histidine triad (HIT) family protein